MKDVESKQPVCDMVLDQEAKYFMIFFCCFGNDFAKISYHDVGMILQNKKKFQRRNICPKKKISFGKKRQNRKSSLIFENVVQYQNRHLIGKMMIFPLCMLAVIKKESKINIKKPSGGI